MGSFCPALGHPTGRLQKNKTTPLFKALTSTFYFSGVKKAYESKVGAKYK